MSDFCCTCKNTGTVKITYSWFSPSGVKKEHTEWLTCQKCKPNKS